MDNKLDHINEKDLREAVEISDQAFTKEVEEISEYITAEMKIKYGVDFTVVKIYFPENCDMIKLIMCSEEDNIKFVVKYYREENNIFDTYLQNLMSVKLSKKLSSTFAQNDLNTFSSFAFIGNDFQKEGNIKLDVDEFLKMYEIREIFGNIIFKDSELSENYENDIHNILLEFSKDNDIGIAVGCYSLGSNYKESISELSDLPSVNSSHIFDKKIVKKFRIYINNNK